MVEKYNTTIILICDTYNFILLCFINVCNNSYFMPRFGIRFCFCQMLLGGHKIIYPFKIGNDTFAIL